VRSEIKKFVVTLLVMRHFFIVRGAPRACVDFCDPTAVSRFNADAPGQLNHGRMNRDDQINIFLLIGPSYSVVVYQIGEGTFGYKYQISSTK